MLATRLCVHEDRLSRHCAALDFPTSLEFVHPWTGQPALDFDLHQMRNRTAGKLYRAGIWSGAPQEAIAETSFG